MKKLKDKKHKYEPPKAMRLNDMKKGDGGCMDGSNAVSPPGATTPSCVDGHSPDFN